MRGNIYSPFAGRAKEYAWNLCLKYAPRNITPTDIDYMTECNSHFLFFEMKTEGAEMPYGQRLALERLLKALPDRAALMLVSHQPVDVVQIPIHVTAIELWVSCKSGIEVAEEIPAFMFAGLYKAFFSWAQGDKDAFDKELGVPRELSVA